MSEHPPTRVLDGLRSTEFARLDAEGHTYLDYTGGALYAESQLEEHLDLLKHEVLGNPHSGNPASQHMTHFVDRARAAVLDFFHADPDEYEVVFTANATGALKLVAEAYPFSAGSRFALTADNHNSVNGIREFARRAGADITYVPVCGQDLRIDCAALQRVLDSRPFGDKLFAYPAQSNLSGVQHALDWIECAQQRGWDVLLDASAFVPTNTLDLSRWRPDFVALSFYKMFGYPTGVGALIARKAALRKLQRPWFAGGTIAFSSVNAAHDDGEGYYLLPGSAGFEDGTVNYLSLPGVEIGLRWLESIGMDAIHAHVMSLTSDLLGQLARLRHGNGAPVVRIYGPHTTFGRGANVALNFLDPHGEVWDCWEVEAIANAQRISLRSGCHCNPGAREAALGFTRARLARHFRNKRGVPHEQFSASIREDVAGVVRVSFGVPSDAGDMWRFMAFAREFVDAECARRVA